jgi:hypothetical protein
MLSSTSAPPFVTPAAGAAYALGGDYCLHPTPAGSYFAVSRAQADAQRAFLQRLLAQAQTPALTVDLMQAWTGLEAQPALAFLQNLQDAGYVQGLPQPMQAPTEPDETLLPALLSQLSDEGRGVLADSAGLLLAAVGFKHAHSEQVAALGAELAALQQRHAALRGQMGLASDGWGLVSAAGYSELSFWPLYIGTARFHLVVGGQPRFNQQAYTRLLWALAQRYAQP